MNGRAVKYWLALLAVSGAIYGSTVAWRAYRPPPAKPAAPPAASYKFELTDQLGRPFDSKRLQGKVWVANFFFTNCPALCRTTNQQLSVLFRSETARGVQFVSLTCDPLTDTPAVLKEYSRAFTGEPDRWAFVTGQFDQIAALATNFFKVALEPKGHSDRCFIVDRAGKVRGNFYVTEPGKLEAMEKLLAQVVAEK